MLALAENTMTRPSPKSKSVAARSGRSIWTNWRFITEDSPQAAHEGFKVPAALLIILILVKGGAGRRQQHRLRRPGHFVGPAHRAFHGVQAFHWGGTPEFAL